MVQAAEAAAQSVSASTHHFRVLQCPMNLFEAGAFRTARHWPIPGSDRSRVCAPGPYRGVGEPAVECHGGSEPDVATGGSPLSKARLSISINS